MALSIEIFNKIVIIIFMVCYFYQFVYIFISLFPNKKKTFNDKKNHYAILIAARNEEAVIANLINSINEQDYPNENIDIYVGADNCNDKTALIARSLGAIVYERYNHEQIGKGYVLNFLLNKIKESGKKYDGYIVFDADNVLDPNFIKEINRVYNDGYQAVTSYRNSKNYGDNWLSAGYALWYIHESCHLNDARMKMGISCAINGTGFLFSQKLIDKYDGWNFFLLTEDIEFTIANVVNDFKVAYAKDAILYDEQPTDFKQSFYQRLRWSKGYLQVFKKYGLDLLKGIFNGSFACYDMTMNYAPAAILSFVSIIVNLIGIFIIYIKNDSLYYLFSSLGALAFNMYLTLFIIGIFTIVTQWKRIYCSPLKKILSVFTCPLFLLTYLPISIIAIFKKVSWTPICHNRILTLNQIKK